MTRRSKLPSLVLCACGCALSHAAPAASGAEAGPGPYNLDLDAGAGKSEQRFLQIPGGAFTVKGYLQFVSIQSSSRWEPMAAVEVMGPKDSYYAGLIAFVVPNSPDKVQFAVRDVRLRGLPDATFARAPLAHLLIPFELHLDRSGTLQVSVAGSTGRAVPVRPEEITRVSVIASTGHMRFTNITITSD